MARKPNSLTLIEDPNLDPFFITKDEHCYTVNRRITSNKDHFRSTGKSKTYTKSLTFHSDFGDALKRITNEQLHNKEHFKNLNDFLDHYTTIETNIKNYLNEKT